MLIPFLNFFTQFPQKMLKDFLEDVAYELQGIYFFRFHLRMFHPIICLDTQERIQSLSKLCWWLIYHLATCHIRLPEQIKAYFGQIEVDIFTLLSLHSNSTPSGQTKSTTSMYHFTFAVCLVLLCSSYARVCPSSYACSKYFSLWRISPLMLTPGIIILPTRLIWR